MRKYANMVVLTNYAIQYFSKKTEEVDQIMCPENTPRQVFNFMKFCRNTLAELITDITSVLKAQGVTFMVSL